MHLLLFCIFVGTGAVAGATSRAPHYSIPRPTGPYRVSKVDMLMTDHSRYEVFAPKPTKRTFMTSVYYPTFGNAGNASGVWFPSVLYAATDEVYTGMSAIFQAVDVASFKANLRIVDEDVPVLFFLHGYRGSRYFYRDLIQNVVSRGYIVISPDSPYAAPATEQAGNTVAHFNISDSSDAGITPDLDLRVGDVRYLLDFIKTRDFTSRIPGLRRPIRTDRAGIFGHSNGGVASALAMIKDKRLVAGINLDGSIFQPYNRYYEGLDHAFLLLASENHTRRTDKSYQKFFDGVKGWYGALNIKGNQHLDFGDLASVIHGVGAQALLPPYMTAEFGTIEPTRAQLIHYTYVTAFFDWRLKGLKMNELFRGPTAQFPEVTYEIKNPRL